MEFKDMKAEALATASNYGERFGITIDKEFAILKFFEEVGELSEAILTHDRKSRPEKLLSQSESKKKMASELADVVGMALVLADVLEIDIEKALHDKWGKGRNQ